MWCFEPEKLQTAEVKDILVHLVMPLAEAAKASQDTQAKTEAMQTERMAAHAEYEEHSRMLRLVCEDQWCTKENKLQMDTYLFRRLKKVLWAELIPLDVIVEQGQCCNDGRDCHVDGLRSVHGVANWEEYEKRYGAGHYPPSCGKKKCRCGLNWGNKAVARGGCAQPEDNGEVMLAGGEQDGE